MQINLELRDKWLLYSGGKPCFLPIGDNEDYSIHFDLDIEEAAVFAVFKRDEKEKRIMPDENGNVEIPLWCLKNGTFNVGIITNGYASTPCPIYVVGSIVEAEGEPTEDPPKAQIEQLIDLVNRTIAGQSGVNIKSVYIDDGELIIELSNGKKINAGKCRGSDETQFLELFKGYGESLSPSENTALIRSAIEFCSKAHIGTLKFPYQKVFLCEMPEDESVLFEVPSNLTIDLNGSEVSLTANKLTGYRIFRLSYTSCENSCIKNGKITGNKDKIYTENGIEYDYDGIKKLTNSLCDWGVGVSLGLRNCRIENVEISQCRGDGISLGGDTLFRNYLPNSLWKAGDIDSQGKYIESTSCVVTKHRWKTEDFTKFGKEICIRAMNDDTKSQYAPEVRFIFFKKVSDEGVTTTKNGSFSDKIDGVTYTATYTGEIGDDSCYELVADIMAIDGQGVDVPDEATNVSVVVKYNHTDNLYSGENPTGKQVCFSILNSYTSDRCVVKGSKIRDCTRNGITFCLAKFCEIDDCTITHIVGGTVESGIDVEEGKTGAHHNVIRNCVIRESPYAICQSQGWNLLIENCVLEGIISGEGSMRGNVIQGCTIRGQVKFGSLHPIDKLKPAVFRDNVMFGTLYTTNALVESCSLHGTVALDYDSVAENCTMVDVTSCTGRFKNCKFEYHDSIDRFDTNIGNMNIVDTRLEFIGCEFTGKNLWFRIRNGTATKIEGCDINVDRISIAGERFVNNKMTYNVTDTMSATIACPVITDNVFNCTIENPGYSTGSNPYHSAISLDKSLPSYLIKGNTFNTNSSSPCVYVPGTCFVTFVENTGSTLDGTVNYDVANIGTSYSAKINGLVGANKNLQAASVSALSDLKRFDYDSSEVAYEFKNVEQKIAELEYRVDGYKDASDYLQVHSSEIWPKDNITLPEKIYIKTFDISKFWLNNFRDHTELSDVVIMPNANYTILRGYAFYGCTNLKSFVCSDNLKEIWGYVFGNCSSLESVDLKNVQSLGNSFSNCVALKKIYLPQTIKSVGTDAFSGCKNLEEVTVEKGFAAPLKLSASTKFTQATLHAIIENLADLTGKDAQTLTLGTANIANIDDKHKTMLTNKNWILK